MELITQTIREQKTGEQAFDLVSGKSLKIETSPSGIEILNFEADKDYRVSILVHMDEVT